MKNLFVLAAAGAMVVAASSIADARGGSGGPAGGGPSGMGASAFAPGQQYRLNGPVAGYPGASGYAPGRMYRSKGAVTGHPGASGYAPGHKVR
jgi:hypothetical protein